MSDDTDFRFALVGEDKYSAEFRKAQAQGRRTGKALEDATRGIGRQADQARSRLEKMLAPARAFAPELDGLFSPVTRTLRAAQALGAAFRGDQAARASKTYRDTAKAGGELGQAFRGSAVRGIVAANDNLGAAATAADKAGESMAAAGAEAAGAGAGFGALAGMVGTVAAGLGAAAAAAIGAEIAVAKFVAPFATRAQQLQNFADTVGVTTTQLQQFQGAAERAGVSKEATAQSLAGLAGVIHSAQYGLDATAIIATRTAGINPGARGAKVDVAAAALQAADAISAQKDPIAQSRLAAALGISAEALPLYRQGRAKVQAMLDAYTATGGVITDDQKAKLLAQREAQTNFNQTLDAKAKDAAAAAAGHSTQVLEATSGNVNGAAPANAAAGVGKLLLDPLKHAADLGARLLMNRIHGAGGKAVGTAAPSGGLIGRAEGAVGDFAEEAGQMLSGIIHQESRGHQADRRGRVLRSNKGAIGAGQLLPETAKRAAAWAGIKWDERRFYDPTDAEYSKALSRAELQRLLVRFGGNKVLAAAAYNAGEGRLLGGRKGPGWLKTIGDPRTGQVSDLDFALRIPFAETRNYVLRTQFGMSEAQARARAGQPLEARAAAPPPVPAEVRGEILVKVEGAPGAKVISKSNGPVRLRVQRTAEFLGAA